MTAHNASCPPRVLLVANTSWYLYNFRFPLIRSLRANGYDVQLVAPHDSYSILIQNEGYVVHNWAVSRSSVNPFSELSALLDLLRIYRLVKPDLLHHFTIKACLYGTIAAKGARVYRVINAVTGLGHVFLGPRKRNRLLRKFLKPIYRAAFTARRSTVVFQNVADQEKLIQLGMTVGERARLIRGSGVDIDFFQPSEDSAGRFHQPLQVLFPSRLIREKGTEELLQACQNLSDRGIKLDLLVAGSLDLGNRSAMSGHDLIHLKSKPFIKCLGHVEDMYSLYASSDIVVLPSWREGLSRSLIEAASMERPIITTDVPGCRDVVDHGRTGLLTPIRDPHSLELAILLLLENPDLARSMAKQARKKVVTEFRVSLINNNTLQQYEQLLARQLERRPLFDGLF